MKSLSIIVPVYNCEKFLNQCVESILSQQFEDYELLLIDDGSTDSSGQMCDKWAANDEKISVFHIANAGVSNARNIGLSSADGKYITFIDSDDYISENFLHKAVDFMETHPEVDYVQYCLERFDENGVYFVEQTESRILTLDAFVERIPFCGSACMSIFKTEIIRLHSLYFNTSLKLGEDQLFVYSYLHFCNYCAKMSDVMYHYRHNSGSVTQNPRSKDMIDSIEAFKAFKYRDEFDYKINETLVSFFTQLVMSDEITVDTLYSIGKDLDFTGVKRDRKILKLLYWLDMISRKFAILIVRIFSHVI